MIRCALAGATTAAALVASVGNPLVVEAARDNGTALATTVSRFASWDVLDAPSDVAGLAAVRIAVLVVMAGVLSGVAGRARSRSAAWLAGWGAVTAAGASAGAAAYAYQVAVVLDGRAVATSYADGLVLAVNSGAAFGLWTGGFVGLAVAGAVASRPAADRETARQAGPRRGPAPPPPWWAPAHGPADTAVHPGPTAYPPGGFGSAATEGLVGPAPSGPPTSRPVAAVNERTAVAGDPHPSDPDATLGIGPAIVDEAYDDGTPPDDTEPTRDGTPPDDTEPTREWTPSGDTGPADDHREPGGPAAGDVPGEADEGGATTEAGSDDTAAGEDPGPAVGREDADATARNES